MGPLEYSGHLTYIRDFTISDNLKGDVKVQLIKRDNQVGMLI